MEYRRTTPNSFAKSNDDTVEEKEMAVKITFGRPGDCLNSGLHFVWQWIQRLVIFPTTMQSIRFAVSSVPTKRGRVDGYHEVIEGTEINALFTIYYYFKKENLKQTVIFAPGISEKELSEELVPYTQDILRNLLGRMPWRLTNEERFKFTQMALSRIMPMNYTEDRCFALEKEKEDENIEGSRKKEQIIHYKFEPIDTQELADKILPKENELKKNSPFVQFGLQKVMLALEDINFTSGDMQEAISAPETARLNKIATEISARAEKYKLSREGEGAANARKEMIRAIQENPDLEVLYTLRELAKGDKGTILYQIPQQVSSKVTELLGGNSAEDMFKTLSPQSTKFLKDLIDDAIRKLGANTGG